MRIKKGATRYESHRQWALLDLNKKTQALIRKELSELTETQKVRIRELVCDYPPELKEIVDRWDSLPEHIKQAIASIVRTV